MSFSSCKLIKACLNTIERILTQRRKPIESGYHQGKQLDRPKHHNRMSFKNYHNLK